MRTSSEAIGQLAGALAKAQAGLINPRKTLTATLEAGPGGDKRSYRYAPLGEGLTIARRTLGRHELAIVQHARPSIKPFVLARKPSAPAPT